MENFRPKLVSTVLGASSCMAGLLSLARCSGGACTSCFGCAGTAAGILLLVLFNRSKANKKEAKNGMA